MKTKFLTSMLAMALIFSVSCSKTDEKVDPDAVELPPYETMAVDFGDFMDDSSNSGKIASTNAKVGNNWLYPRVVVGLWNTALFTTLAVPVASFKSAFAHRPVFLGDNTWQWSYTVDGFTSQYAARLTGEVSGDVIIWKMYVTKSGIGAFDEFMWFSGESSKNGTHGHWVLNQSADRPNKMLRIDWERANEEIGSIRYSWVRDLKDDESTDLFKDSYLEYGLQDGDYDVFYNVHAYDENMEEFVDVNIEWNRTSYFGRVMSPSYFQDEIWHCWDTLGEDVACE
jgi:hypothetical protein